MTTPRSELARARRVRPTAAELNAPTLDGTLTPSHGDTTRPRRRHDAAVPVFGRRPPRVLDPYALNAVVFGVAGALGSCLWPVGGAASLFAVGFGVAALSGPARRQAVAGLLLGLAGLVSSLGVLATTVVLMTAEPLAVPRPVVVPAPPPPPVPRPFLPLRG